jgi:hypothetical protein
MNCLESVACFLDPAGPSALAAVTMAGFDRDKIIFNLNKNFLKTFFEVLSICFVLVLGFYFFVKNFTFFTCAGGFLCIRSG